MGRYVSRVQRKHGKAKSTKNLQKGDTMLLKSKTPQQSKIHTKGDTMSSKTPQTQAGRRLGAFSLSLSLSLVSF